MSAQSDRHKSEGSVVPPGGVERAASSGGNARHESVPDVGRQGGNYRGALADAERMEAWERSDDEPWGPFKELPRRWAALSRPAVVLEAEGCGGVAVLVVVVGREERCPLGPPFPRGVLVRPLPLQVFWFQTEQMLAAFEKLRRGEHIGRLVAMVGSAPNDGASERGTLGWGDKVKPNRLF